MGVLSNGLVLLGISAFWQQLLVGGVIVAAVAVDQLKTRAVAVRWRRAPYVVFAALGMGALALSVLRPAAPQGEARRLTVAVVGKASGGEYWLAVKAGAEKKARELDVEVLWQGTPQETDVAKQIDLVENLVQRRVDGIAIAPTDANALSPVLKDALAAGVAVVTVDSDSTAKDRASYIGTDNRAAGVLAGQEMARLVGGRGKVAIVTGVLGAQNLRQRCEGFREGLAGTQIELLAEQSDGGDRAKALAIAENVLVAHPDVSGFFADTAIGGPAVAQALIARGLAGKVKLLSFDTTPALLRYLDEGVVQGLVAQQPERMGELAVEMLVEKARGKEIPAVIDTGVKIVSKGPP
jgi:ribose transport system substrate-binding protein